MARDGDTGGRERVREIALVRNANSYNTKASDDNAVNANSTTQHPTTTNNDSNNTRTLEHFT